MKKVEILFAPFEYGLNIIGTGLSYTSIKNHYLELVSGANHINFSTFSKTETVRNMNNFKTILNMIEVVSKRTYNISKTGNIPLTIGGDHSISLGTISGMKQKENDLAIIWIDAHGDMNTNQSSESGNVHGMVLSTLQGIGDKELIDSLQMNEFIRTQDIHIFGVRDIDIKEKIIIDKLGVKYTSYTNILATGVINALEKIINQFKRLNKKVHLSIDLDSLNPIEVPGVSVPVNSGFSKIEVKYIVKQIIDSLDVISIDIVEYNPLKDKDYKTLRFLTTLINLIKAQYELKRTIK